MGLFLRIIEIKKRPKKDKNWKSKNLQKLQNLTIWNKYEMIMDIGFSLFKFGQKFF